MIVISNTSPLHYLILIEAEHVLPKLYGKVLIPAEVLSELRAEKTPERLRETNFRAPKSLFDVLLDDFRETPRPPQGHERDTGPKGKR